MGSAALFLLVPGLLDGTRGGIGWPAAAAVLVLGLGNGTLAVLLYFALIAGAGATPTMLSAYLVPVTALILGVAVLDEPLTASAVVGMILILGGVALGTGTVLRRVPAAVGHRRGRHAAGVAVGAGAAVRRAAAVPARLPVTAAAQSPPA